jgi:hypothetical protein
MKKSLSAIALALVALTAQAQTANSGSQSGSQSGADSASISGVQSTNSGNTTAIGNQNASRSDSSSQSGASSGSQSGALGNAVYIDQSGPSSQTLNQTVNGTTNSTSKETADVHYSGGTKNETVSSGTVTNRVEYSGSQTIKNVPSIAMSGPASGPCTGVSGGLSGAGPGWGIGFNASSVMADCRMRENTRVLGMAMQSLDGTANPQEKGEVTVLFMDAVRGLAAYNNQIVAEEVKAKK